MADLVIRPTTSADRETVAATLAEAMFDDPFNLWLLPDINRRRAKIAAGMAQQFDLFHRRGGGWIADNHAGAALWAPPGQWKLKAVEQIRMLPRLVNVMGWPSLRRILGGFSQLDKRHPEEPHWYLVLLGVAPEHQGTGLGKALLRPVLEICDREGIGAYLETANIDDLGFYRNYGFDTRDEFDLSEGPHIWTMWRQPTTSKA